MRMSHRFEHNNQVVTVDLPDHKRLTLAFVPDSGHAICRRDAANTRWEPMHPEEAIDARHVARAYGVIEWAAIQAAMRVEQLRKLPAEEMAYRVWATRTTPAEMIARSEARRDQAAWLLERFVEVTGVRVDPR